MSSLSIQVLVKNFKKTYKLSSARHQDMYTSLRNVDLKPIPENPNKVMIDYSLLDKLMCASSFLLDIDKKTLQNIKNLHEISTSFIRIRKLCKLVKSQLFSLEKTVSKEMKINEYIITSMGSIFSKIKENDVSSMFRLAKNNKEKIKSTLKNFINKEVIESFEKNTNPKIPIVLLHNFHSNIMKEEPETEIGSDIDSVKCANHNKKFMRAFKIIAKDMLKLLSDNTFVLRKKTSDAHLNFLEDTKNPRLLSPKELKTLKLKVNRLRNRGSLTEEEARNVLGRISVLPVSPAFFGNECLKVSMETSHDEQEEEPITETREKKGSMEKSYSKIIASSLSKIKKSFKRTSTPGGKRILRNASLPKAVSVSKCKNREKTRFLKIKSKPQHSFL